MTLRPIDIARRLRVSTSTLRKYEEAGLVPEADRTAAGYRTYTLEHAAYFACVRGMLPAFDLVFIRKVMRAVQERAVDKALWQMTKAQAGLWQERQIVARFMDRMQGAGKRSALRKDMTIAEASQETGIPVTTIRYWEKAGLLSVPRNRANRYRLYGDAHIESLLLLYAVKLSVQGHRGRHYITAMREAYEGLDQADDQQVAELAGRIARHMDAVNRRQMEALAALLHLCRQVERGVFDPFERT